MRSLSRLVVLTFFCGATILVSSPPAFAICSFDAENAHVVGSVNHGWSRLFCLPSGDYDYTVFTNHGHGMYKYVALWHSGAEHLHCSDLESGSVNASCSRTVSTTHHQSSHDIADVLSCTDRFNDGHGFDCHFMEAIP